MTQLQKSKFEILDFVHNHPEIRLVDIAAKYKCSISWLKQAISNAGLKRGQGWGSPAYSEAILKRLNRKRDRLINKLLEVETKIAAVTKPSI